MGIKFVKKTIGDCFDLINGYAFKSNEFISSGNPVIKIKNIKAGYFSEHEFSYVDDNFLITKTEKIVQESDLLISMTGNRHDGTPETWVGKIALFPYKKINNFFLNQRVGALRVKDNAKINPIYASYVLSSWEYQQWFIAIATSSGGQANLSPKQILETEFEFPDKNIQDLIANILSSFDKKITLNRQINQTLEQMAQTLFKSWFVDFDPVIDNALDAGNDIPDTLQERAEQRRLLRAKADFKPLPAETRALFPSEFEETELGWVPKGWKYHALSEICRELKRGISPKYTEIDGVCVINQKCIRNHEIDFSLARRNDVALKKITGYELEIGDVVVNSTGVGTLGRLAQVKYLPETTVFDSHVTLLRAREEFVPKFFFGQLIQLEEKNIESLGEGSTGQTELSRKILGEQRVLIPPLNVSNKVEKMLVDYASSYVSNTLQTQSLTRLRDVLLPKLISGELELDALPEVPELAEAR